MIDKMFLFCNKTGLIIDTIRVFCYNSLNATVG